MTRVLAVDDEPPMLRALSTNLRARGYDVDLAPTGEAALDLAARHHPDIVILDLGLPGITGLEVIRGLRGWTDVPILILSARDGEDDKIAALDAGADDYVTKPFSTVELQARIRAHLRRTAAAREGGGPTRVEADGLVIDLEKRAVSRNGTRIHLTPIEWDLLRVLVTNPGKTLTHAYLFAQVWNRSQGDAQQYLRVHVASLRRKIERDTLRPALIHTEPGVGYRFETAG